MIVNEILCDKTVQKISGHWYRGTKTHEKVFWMALLIFGGKKYICKNNSHTHTSKNHNTVQNNAILDTILDFHFAKITVECSIRSLE